MKLFALISAAVQKVGDSLRKTPTQAIFLAGGSNGIDKTSELRSRNPYIITTDLAEAITFKPGVFQCQIPRLPENVTGNTLLITDGPQDKTVCQFHEYDFRMSHHFIYVILLAHVMWWCN